MQLFKQNFDLVKVDGSDSLSFLNRLTTNLCLKLNHSEIVQTSVLNSKGKILDLINLFINNNQVYFLSSYNSSEILINHFNKYIVSDDVEFKFIKGINCSICKDLSQVENNIYSKYFGNTIEIDFNKSISLEGIDEMNLNTIISGIPTYLNEINSAFSPQEINLGNTISNTKGCYLGQEVIARSETYNKAKYILYYIKSDKELMENYIIENKTIAIKTRQIYSESSFHSSLLAVKNKLNELLQQVEKQEVKIAFIKEFE